MALRGTRSFDVEANDTTWLSGVGDVGLRHETPVITLRTGTINRYVWTVAGALIVATFAAQFAYRAWGNVNVVHLFDSDQKLNFPSAFKIVLLLATAALLGIVGVTVRDRWHRRRWLGMSAVFVLLSIDEMTYMHQRLSDGIRHVLHTGGPLRLAWVIVYLPLVAVLAKVYWPFWRRLSEPLRTRLLLAALGFAAGSGGIELIKGVLYHDNRWTLSYGLVAAVSDSLEMLGLAQIVTALLTTLNQATAGVVLSLTP